MCHPVHTPAALLLVLALAAAPAVAAPPATGGRVLLAVTGYGGDLAPKHPTGYWVEELAVPFKVLTEAGFDVVVGTPTGKTPPPDPASLTPEMKAALESPALKKALASPARFADLKAADFRGVFVVGGHGVLFDLVGDKDLERLFVGVHDAEGGAVAAVCHGPAALVGMRKADGSPLVKNRSMTGFSDPEEKEVGLVEAVAKSPFGGSLAGKLSAAGAVYASGKPWQPFVRVCCNLVTGQNPQSSEATAKALIGLLKGLPVDADGTVGR